MNDSDQHIEDLLRELKPRELSPELRDKLAKLPADEEQVPAPPKPAPQRRPIPMLWAAAAGFLLALAAIGWQAGWLAGKTTGTPLSPAPVGEGLESTDLVLEPVSCRELLTGEYDEGVVPSDEDGEPVQKIRRELLRETQFVDPKTGKTVTVHEPVEDFVFVKLEHY